MDHEVDPGDFAPGWDNVPNENDLLTFQNNVEPRKSWVVLLEFFRNGKNAIGTGFFINLPGSQSDVILTAGHNLLGSTNMKVWNSEPGHGPVETSIETDNFRICPEYAKDPDSKIYDYGAILLKPKVDRPGFGFNIRFASQGLGEKGDVWDSILNKVVPVDNSGLQVHITGYKNAPAGNPFESQGQLITHGNERLRPDQLEYAIDAKEGVSGSPVWRVDKGGESVVAIHNNGPRGRGRGSRGTRLNDKVLRRIFEWAEVGYESKALKVCSPKADIRGGLYLQFQPGDNEAWLGVGPDSPMSRFDVLPAYARPGKLSPDLALYAFFYKDQNSVGKGKWVTWKWRQEKAELRESIMDSSMVSLRRMPKNEGFKIVLEREATQEEKRTKRPAPTTVFVELIVDDSTISEDDVKRAKNKGKTAQVQDFLSFGAFRRTKETEFNVFCLE